MNFKTFARFNHNYNYVFIDESGNPSNKMFQKTVDSVHKNGYAEREFSTFTISGVFIKSKKQYSYLKKSLTELKNQILNLPRNIHIHRCDLKSNEFLNKNGINRSNVWRYENRLLDLAIKHKLPIFSASINREKMMNAPDFELNNYVNKFNTLKYCIERLMKNIVNFLKNRRIWKKTYLVFEVTSIDQQKRVLTIFNDYLEKNKFAKKFIKGMMFMTKKDNKENPISGNELIDFINYPLFLWASNTGFQISKMSFYLYPRYEKKSISLVETRIQ
jgi:hypothetical protein